MARSKKPAAPRKATAKAAPVESLDDLPPAESEAAFDKYIAVARAYSGPLKPYRTGALLMRTNADRCVAALRPREAEIAKHLPLLDRPAMWSAPELALAVAFAARTVLLESPAESELPGLLARVYELRDLLLTTAEALAKAGLFKKAEVEKIRTGHGKADAAQDCVDLAALFRKNAAKLRGKTAITAAQVREAGDVGARAVKLLKPAHSKNASAGPSDTRLDLDRLQTLLVLRHADLRRAGSYFWLDEVDQHVPALLSREMPGRPRKTTEKPDTTGKPA